MKLRIIDVLLGLVFLLMVIFLAYKYFIDPSKLDVLKESLNYISYFLNLH